MSKRWIVKVGSALLADGEEGLHIEHIERLARGITMLKNHDVDVALVSSGAIAAGLNQMGFSSRPQELGVLQAVAAVGQGRLIMAWESAFARYGQRVGQLLLCHDDLANSIRRANVKATLESLLKLNILTIINENDSVAVEEIRFGDNDMLAASLVQIFNANRLIFLTDQSGFFERDPRHDPEAKIIAEATVDDQRLDNAAGGGGSLGRGGMISKLRAARLAAESGVSTSIVSGLDPDCLEALVKEQQRGTMLLPVPIVDAKA